MQALLAFGTTESHFIPSTVDVHPTKIVHGNGLYQLDYLAAKSALCTDRAAEFCIPCNSLPSALYNNSLSLNTFKTMLTTFFR